MARKRQDKEALKENTAKEPSTEAPKRNARANTKKERKEDTAKNRRTRASRTASTENREEQTLTLGAAGSPAKASERDKSAGQIRSSPKNLKKWHEKTKTGPNAVDFPVVAIGASAGGLEAFEHFFTHMPPDTGMAFVIVQHLDPSHKSILAELIRRYTRMEVSQVKDGVMVEPNSVYVIPPNSYMAILNGKLHLLEPTEVPGLRTPIDYFFRSLAEDQREKSICIVMSGTGTEGALGLRAVKGEGGMGMVQDPVTAKYDGMPQSAVATGMADFVLPVNRMPAQLIDYVDHARARLRETTKVPSKTSDLMDKIFLLVREQTGHDFSLYKRSTILRRIERRMAINRLRKMEDYVRFLQRHPEEAVTLFKELLISVTSFFRDPDAFAALKQKALKKTLRTGPKNRTVRIWVPGCSTGEEAYSITMLAMECMEQLKITRDLQVFATDIYEDAIETARAGIYPRSISVDVTEDRLTRFFSEEESTFRVKKEIRDKIVFAVQNVVNDPPFSKMDLISCRNLMIYLTTDLQRKLITLFHYALRPGGYLFLGTAESLGELGELFTTADRKWKLFVCKESGQGHPDVLTFPLLPRETYGPGPAPRPPATARGTNYREAVDRWMLDSYSPAGVVVNDQGEILYVHGKTGKYLEPAPGRAAPMNVVTMAREGLRLELASAVRKASGLREEMRVGPLRVKTNGDEQPIYLIVKPFSDPAYLRGLHIVVFEDVSEKEYPNQTPIKAQTLEPANRRIEELEKELRSAKEYLQSTIEELETSNEELKSSNEELQSSNEELQSTNEELETSKEELQSVNEELGTVNTELQQKIDELSRASSDMNNLLASTQIATIFLDSDLHVRRFTPKMNDFIPLIQSDVGRPVKHVASSLKYAGLLEDSKQVLKTLIPVEKEVQSENGDWYNMRILPYRTVNNVIDGVVITFADITKLQTAISELDGARARELTEAGRSRKYAESIVDTVRHPLLVLDEDLRVCSANKSFYRSFGTNREKIVGKRLYELGEGEWNIQELRNLLEKILPDKATVESFRVDHKFKSGRRVMLVNARKLQEDITSEERILLAIEEVEEDV